MTDFFGTIFIGTFILASCLSCGSGMEVQLNYPRDEKHSIRLTKKRKFFLYLENKKNKIRCSRAAYIEEMAGYVVFIAYILLAIVCSIINYAPSWQIIFVPFGAFELINIICLTIVYAYYHFKYK